MDMIKEIRIEEGKLKVVFEIRDNGVVELKQFDPSGRIDAKEKKREAEDFYPITEIQITGKGSRRQREGRAKQGREGQNGRQNGGQRQRYGQRQGEKPEIQGICR